ncbi:uncharacterized protein LOC122506053 [Leptopilina heterotoma]|uniref:uncharacterized protein LOC122506053 n=1 Tax=Leptopilina heterotoma TaxID=63436 RepID=UPI001CA7C8A6|nr:uncharacterized protein LOC122506053 [Leptopilina heterotoma]
MKKVILFVILVSSFQASLTKESDRNGILLKLETIQDEIKNAITDLKSFEIIEFEKIYQLFGQHDLNLTRSFRNIKKMIYSEIKIEYKKLNAVNENSTDCYKIAQRNMNDIYENKTELLGMCEFKSFFLNFSPIMTHVNFTLQVCENLLMRFDSMQEERIVVIKDSSLEMAYLKSSLSGIEILANNCRNLIRDVKKMVLDLSEKAVFNIQNCAESLEKSLLDESKRIKEDFQFCIKK